MTFYRSVEEEVKRYMQRALEAYPEAHYGQFLSVSGEGAPFLSVFLFEGGLAGKPKAMDGGYSFEELRPLPAGASRVVLSQGL